MLGNVPAERLRIIEGIAARARGQCRRKAPLAVDDLVRAYYHGVAEQDLSAHDPRDLAGATLAHLEFAKARRRGKALVRVFNPDPVRDGFASPHTVVMLATDDMPFLVDSVSIVFTQGGLNVHFIAHPVLSVTRDGHGHLRALYLDDAPAGAQAESWQLIEVDRVEEPEQLEALRNRLSQSLDDVRCATEDWQEMRRQAREIAANLELSPHPVGSGELLEAKALLEWMEDHHFTMLGYREYRLRRGRSQDVLEPLPETGLGLLRPGRAGPGGRGTVTLSGDIRKFARSKELLVLTKANSISTVHRATHLDYVSVKTFDRRGEVVGERRFIGLWTSTAYSSTPRDIPVLRHKVQQVIAHFGLAPSSHDGKAVMHALEVYPRDELFQASVPELIRIVRGIVNLYERAEVRMFTRRDAFRRFYSCLLYVPRDRYNTEVRRRIEDIVREVLGGIDLESQVQLSESVLARVFLLVRTERTDTRKVDMEALEARIREAVRTWCDRLAQALVEQHGEGPGKLLLERFGRALPAAYQEDLPPAVAVTDIARLQELERSPKALVMGMYRGDDQPAHKMQFKLYRRGNPIPISDVLPTIENLGLKLISERPYELELDGESWWIQDFELEHPQRVSIDLDSDGPRFRETFEKVWLGHKDNDGFNRLVLAADLDWREVSILRTYARWYVQLGLPLSQAYMEEALASNPAAARHLVGLFHARFDPAMTRARRAQSERSHREALAEILEGISRVDDDRIVRAFLAAVDATLRTNFYRRGADGEHRGYLSLKLDPRAVPDAPLPRPMFEIFTHSPRFEGVHLRMGKVARGGIRWSDRREDFRTEILGLMKAQNVKNTVIVPVGSKGGFVPRRLPAAREEAQREGTECYRLFIRSLLDVTDNLVDGKVVPPEGVVRADGNDPYLVVAADKGTATFSDIANEIAASYDFWLGDAFASGGSAGYDHKKMGITARGGWECVKRHFREMGVDIQREDFTVVGIGDMSGDVFGNGMLLSRHIRLVAAFNHQHIFLDPEPDASRSYKERERLFRLPRSSWEDYDRKLISRGGGIYPRNAKTVPLSARAQQLLDMETSNPSPREVVRAILRLPVDLLWNGGIGTYVKAAEESQAEIGDRTNDAVRVDGRELRCKVVGEGGNLGLSQRGRIEYALNGGRVNTDFIDNSGGVNCSDLEVNIKILLNAAMRARKRLRRGDRDRLLASMTEEVAGLVLRGNYLQSQAISTLEASAVERIAEHAHVIRALERSAGLNRTLEALPTDDELSDRRRLGQGLSRPELAMVLSYSKLWLYDRLIESDVPEDPYLGRELTRYFPEPVQRRFAAQIPEHPLRREIIVTATSNSMVNRMGPVFAIRAQEDTGAGIGRIARAYSIAREITDMRDLWADIERLDNRVPAELQRRMLYASSRLLRYLTYWVLANVEGSLDIDRAVSALRPGLKELLRQLPAFLLGIEAERYSHELGRLRKEGAPEDLARRVASLGSAQSAVDIVDVSRTRGISVEHAARVYFGLGQETGLDWIHGEIEMLSVEGHWQAVARGTLREQCYSLHRQLCDAAVAGRRERDPGASISAWLDAHRLAVENVRRTVQEMKSIESVDFATLSVAIQAVRRLRDPEARGAARSV
jgi:glutamate dehydrogenase